MEYNEYSLKLSKATEKVLHNEKRNKRKSKLFKNDENISPNRVTVSNLKFKEEDYIISSECKYTLEQFEKLSVDDCCYNTGGLLATIRKELEAPTPREEFMKLSKPRKLLFTEGFNVEPIDTIASKKAKIK